MCRISEVGFCEVLMEMRIGILTRASVPSLLEARIHHMRSAALNLMPIVFTHMFSKGTFNTTENGSHHHRVGRGNNSTGAIIGQITWGDGGGYNSFIIDAGDTGRGTEVRTIIAETAGQHSHTVAVSGATQQSGGNETRPAKLYVNFMIRY
jgi:hypothetical protein